MKVSDSKLVNSVLIASNLSADHTDDHKAQVDQAKAWIAELGKKTKGVKIMRDHAREAISMLL